jgi:hypothetical protein
MEPIYGLMAEFDTPTELVEAAKRSYADGYRKMDTYSPFPIEEASEAIGFHKDRVALIVLIGGILGGLSGYLLQYWINVINYPLNVVSLVAVIHHRDFRDDDPVRRNFRSGGDVGTERFADAVSPGF